MVKAASLCAVHSDIGPFGHAPQTQPVVHPCTSYGSRQSHLDTIDPKKEEAVFRQRTKPRLTWIEQLFFPCLSRKEE